MTGGGERTADRRNGSGGAEGAPAAPGEETRPDREVVAGEVVAGRGHYRALEAWRGAGGHRLCYFLALEDGAPAADDREDRRAVLEPGERLEAMEEARLLELLEAAAALTVTERRFSDRRGTVWLAQNVGPVWAEGDVAAGLTGVLFTALSGAPRRAEAAAGHVAHMDEEDLRLCLAGALRSRVGVAEGAAEEARPPGEAPPPGGGGEGGTGAPP